MAMRHSLRSFFPAALTFVMLAVLLGLGGWQVERLAWKTDLLARMDARRDAPPLLISGQTDIAALNRGRHEFHPAQFTGRFGDDVVFWFTQIENKPSGLARLDAAGYHMLVPFMLEDGSAILVDRGFIPARLLDIPAPPPPQGLQNLSVILRWPDGRGAFDNADDPSRNLFYVRDPKAIGAHWQFALPPMLGEAAIANESWPRGGQTRFSMPNNHLQYAVTWFGLAIVLVIVSGLWHIRFLKSQRANAARGETR
jgi:surfeit locus 1 family protein